MSSRRLPPGAVRSLRCLPVWLALVLALTVAGVAIAQSPFDPAGPVVIGSPGAARVDRTMSIGKARVNVRSGPGTNYAVIATLDRGVKGTVLDQKNGWIKLKFSDRLTGWVRGDLLSEGTGSTTGSAGAKDRAYLTAAFSRWDRHLGKTTLDTTRLPVWRRLARAGNALAAGDWETAYALAQDDSTDPKLARYVMAKALAMGGKYTEAVSLLKSIERALEDDAFNQVIDKYARPYIDEPIVFKFGGFDNLATYRAKKARGQRLGLESSEYYDDFVDIKTWKWRSDAKAREFQQIGGIDCSGFVQMLQKEAFADARVPWPIPGRTSTSGLWSGRYANAVNPGFKPPPPPDARPGDMFLLDYGHSRYGHSMIYKGTDERGNIKVVMMGDTATEAILSPDKYQYFKGAYRMKGLDQVRARLTA